MLDAFRPDAAGAFGRQVNPAIDERPQSFVGEGAGLAGAARQRAGQKLSLHQHLKTIADADDRPAGFDEAFLTRRKDDGRFDWQDSPSGDVVAVAETAGDCEDLVRIEQARILHQAVDVHALGQQRRPASKGVGGFGRRNWCRRFRRIITLGFHAFTVACN